MVALGIDLGTTNCCVAVVRNGKVEVLENNLGKRTTPSLIGFIKGEVIVGEAAKRDRARYPENVIYDVKRLIGAKFSDPIVGELISNLPFSVLKDKNQIKICTKENTMYTPEALSAFILKQLKKDAEARLDVKNIDQVVITVPTYFNESQRQATIDAGKMAGFKSIQLLNEPTAAAIHYGIDNKISDGRTILVFDFGGGTFDVSIIKYQNHHVEVLAIDGDKNLGGEDIDHALMDYIIKENNLDRKTNRLIPRLKAIAETAKIDLSTKHHTEIEILLPPIEIEMDISRSKFNELIKHIIDKTMSTVENCLTREKMTNVKIDDVLLVGGSTRIKKISDLLYDRFGKPSKQNINADESVAAGAAIWAARLYDGAFQDLKIFNICPFTLGVEIKNGKMSRLIEKYSVIPVSATKKYKTIDKDQTTITIKIYSGESENVSENCFLGEFTVSNIASGPQGTFLKETFTVDQNGILTVTAIDESGNNNELCLTLETGNLSNEDIKAITKELNIQLDRSDDIAIVKKYKNDIEELISRIESTNTALFNSTKKWLGGIENVPESRKAVEKKFEELRKQIKK